MSRFLSEKLALLAKQAAQQVEKQAVDKPLTTAPPVSPAPVPPAPVFAPVQNQVPVPVPVKPSSPVPAPTVEDEKIEQIIDYFYALLFSPSSHPKLPPFLTKNSKAAMLSNILYESRNSFMQVYDTQKKQQSQDEIWRLAIECSRDGIFEVNFMDNSAPFYSRRLKEMHPCEVLIDGELQPMPFEEWIKLIHMQDQKAKEIFSLIVEDKYQRDDWEMVFRMKDLFGDYCWRHSRGHVFFDPQRHITRIIGIFEDIHDQKSREEQFLYRATHDFLTDLANRDLFYHTLAKMLASIDYTQNSSLLVVMLDLDYFKKVNDTMGHDVGDKLLQEFAHRLHSAIRQDDLAARYGGDEFAALLQCQNDPATHIALVERIRNSLKAPLMLQNKPYEICASMGVAIAPINGVNSLSLLKCADDALYAAKRAGRDQYKFYREVTAEDLAEKLREEKTRKR